MSPSSSQASVEVEPVYRFYIKDHQVLEQARKRMPYLKDRLTSIFAINDRYDVGLWCDALETRRILLPRQAQHTQQGQNQNYYVLSNDSIFALKPFAPILQELQKRNLTMTSLNFSNRGGYWLESVLRGFSQAGLNRFVQHACVPRTHRYYCPWKPKKQQKRCIVEHFEIQVARLFDRNATHGFFPSDTKSEGIRGRKTWVAHPRFWRRRLLSNGFPAAKTKNPHMIVDPATSPELKRCTRKLDWNWLRTALQFETSLGQLDVLDRKEQAVLAAQQQQQKHQSQSPQGEEEQQHQQLRPPPPLPMAVLGRHKPQKAQQQQQQQQELPPTNQAGREANPKIGNKDKDNGDEENNIGASSVDSNNEKERR